MAETEEEVLAGIWAAHRESVWRLLLALARDMDLADDLLQDTYLRAREGLRAYRHGDPRAWLAATARNVYYSHVRQRRVSAEVFSTHPEQTEAAPPPVDLVALLAVRQALAVLPATFRIALVMKHYAGYTYQEIARHQQCPVGTAKWRVSEALSRLRSASRRERRTAMAGCAEAHELGLVDYVYGLLTEQDAARVREHLAQCDSCRKEAEELGKVVTLLEAMEGQRKMMHFLELGREGQAGFYCVMDLVNDREIPTTTFEFQSSPGTHTEHGRVYHDGEEAPYTVEQSEEYGGNYNSTVALRRPVPPGERITLLTADLYEPPHWGSAEPLRNGKFRFHWTQCPSSSFEYAYVQAVRLPAGAKLLSVDEPPDETRRDGTTTLIWRRVMPPATFLECTVEYQVQTQ